MRNVVLLLKMCNLLKICSLKICNFHRILQAKKKTLFVFLFFSYSAVSHLRVVCESLSNVRYSQWSRSEVFLFYGFLFWAKYPANKSLLKVSNRNSRKRLNLFKVNIKTPERRQWYRLDAFLVNFEHVSHFS